MTTATKNGLGDDWSEVEDEILGDCFLTLQSHIERARTIISLARHPQVTWCINQKVSCAIDVHGDDDMGDEVCHPAGATGVVDLVEVRRGTPVVHVIFDRGVVNVFEGPELAVLSVVSRPNPMEPN